jgi:hypothetical protein
MLTISLGFRIGSLGTSTYSDKLCSPELDFDLRLSVFQEHGQNFAEVCVQLIERFGLRVCTGKTRDEAHEEAGFWATVQRLRCTFSCTRDYTSGRASFNAPGNPKLGDRASANVGASNRDACFQAPKRR